MSHANIVPSLRYHDAPAAIDWLCRAFGFEKQLVVPGEDHSVAHAQLVLSNGMLMLSSWRDGDAWGRLVKPPRDRGGATGAIYVIVPDADRHHAAAVAAGAEIIEPLEDKPYGGRGYGCLDLEGNVWSFGTYDPWS